VKIGRCEVAERSRGLPHKNNSRSAGLVPGPILPKMGGSRPKLPERCHPLTCPRIPNLVRIGCVLPDLFQKDWFFGPKTQYPAFSHRPLKIFYEVYAFSLQLSGVVLSDLQWLRKISNYKNCHAVSLRTTFQKVIAKILKIPMDPSSRTREWLPSVLILRGLCSGQNNLQEHLQLARTGDRLHWRH